MKRPNLAETLAALVGAVLGALLVLWLVRP
jgi:uncharacterized membrane protein YeaQ/YmgE (transglycosylase-associated protein family)